MPRCRSVGFTSTLFADGSSGLEAVIAYPFGDWEPDYPLARRRIRVATDARIFEIHGARSWKELPGTTTETYLWSWDTEQTLWLQNAFVDSEQLPSLDEAPSVSPPGAQPVPPGWQSGGTPLSRDDKRGPAGRRHQRSDR
jgi:hypothetical protein